MAHGQKMGQSKAQRSKKPGKRKMAEDAKEEWGLDKECQRFIPVIQGKIRVLCLFLCLFGGADQEIDGVRLQVPGLKSSQ